MYFIHAMERTYSTLIPKSSSTTAVLSGWEFAIRIHPELSQTVFRWIILLARSELTP
jgi:hypothetical protein